MDKSDSQEKKPMEFWIKQCDSDTGAYWKVHGPGVWTENKNATDQFIHVIEKSAYDELLKRHLSIESIGPLALENQQLRADLSLAIEALHRITDAFPDNWQSKKAKETLAKLQEKINENLCS
jgi:hypothetical protein